MSSKSKSELRDVAWEVLQEHDARTPDGSLASDIILLLDEVTRLREELRQNLAIQADTQAA